MKRLAVAGALLAAMVCASETSRAADPIAIAHTESVGSLPVRIATQRGWWARVGLAPRFATFPSELPLMAASSTKAWDVAVVGVGVAVLGAARYETTVIGTTTDRSTEVALFAGGPEAALPGTKLPALPVFANRGTTAALTAIACLDKLGIAGPGASLRDRQPADVARALTSGDAILGAVPSPFIETVRRSGRAAQLCAARDADLVAIDDIVVRHEFLEKSADVTTRAMAALLRAAAWLQANPEQARELVGAARATDAQALRREVAAVTFDLERTMRIFAATSDGPEIHRWHDRVAAIQRRAGDVREAPFAASYVNGSVLARIAADPKLRAFATLGDSAD